MKDFFSKNGIWILLVAVIVTVTMAALSAFGTGVATPLRNAAGVITAPFRAGFSAAANWVDDRARFADDYDALKEENAALKEKVAKLEQENRQAQADSAENASIMIRLTASKARFTPSSSSMSAHSRFSEPIGAAVVSALAPRQ